MAGKKVVRYRRKPKAAAIIFGIVLVYIVCFIVIYVSKAKVQTYEVEVGSLMNNASFTAVALRQEEVYNSSYSGDINYYQREGNTGQCCKTSFVFRFSHTFEQCFSTIL